MSPASLRAAAADLVRAADRAVEVLPDVRRLAGPDTWRGPVSDRFQAELARQQAHVWTAAEELRATAARLTARAEALEAELAATTTRVPRAPAAAGPRP